MARPRDYTLLGVTVGHAVHDAWYGVSPVLLAAVSAQMQLSNSDIGLMLLLYHVLSSVTQPFFGRLAERIGGRPLAVGSIVWTTSLFTVILFVNSKLWLGILIFLAGIGSGAWHPQGAANASRAGGERWGATAASVFFQGGMLGSALLGAALGGYLISAYGRHALVVISAITITLALTVVRRCVPRRIAQMEKHGQPVNLNGAAGTNGLGAVLAFLLLATAFRALTHNTLNAYVPKYQQDLGVSSAVYGLVMSAFMIATAVGGVAGSYLSDRLGMRAILAGSLFVGAIPLMLFLRTEGLVSYAFFVLCGVFEGPSHTILVVAAQRRFPQRIAMISGIFLGFTFVSGAVGAWLLGLLADRVGLHTMLGVLPWALVGAAFFSFLGTPRPQPMEKKAAAEA